MVKILLLVLLIFTVGGVQAKEPKMVTCHLWKYISIMGVQQCWYRGPNGSSATYFPTPLIPKYEYGSAFRQCPKSFECVYKFKKRRPSAKEILDGLKEDFE